MSELLATDWFVWGIGLILGFQLLVVVLGEAIYLSLIHISEPTRPY